METFLTMRGRKKLATGLISICVRDKGGRDIFKFDQQFCAFEQDSDYDDECPRYRQPGGEINPKC